MTAPALNACDFAYPPGDVSIEQFYKDLHAAGVRVVQRYLWRGGKGVTAREIAAAKAAGVRIVYGYEGQASNWRGGAAQGVKDAADAVAIIAELSLPVPKGEPIYYAVDEDAAGLGMLATAVAYARAANRPDHPGRGYGQFALAEALQLPTFQTYAWSGGQVSKHAALYQWHNNQPLAGGTVDYCAVLDAAALGVQSQSQEDDVTPQDIDTIVNRVSANVLTAMHNELGFEVSDHQQGSWKDNANPAAGGIFQKIMQALNGLQADVAALKAQKPGA